MLGRLLALLLKRVKDVYCFVEGCDVEHAMLAFRMNADLYDTGAHSRHGFPIGWQEAALYLVEFESSAPASVSSERLEGPLKSAADEASGFESIG